MDEPYTITGEVVYFNGKFKLLNTIEDRIACSQYTKEIKIVGHSYD
jgi:hypothetical protein